MRQSWTSALAFVGFLLLTHAGQAGRSAAALPFGSRFSDEPAHYVTGLMVRRYVETGLGTNPMEFAKDYYARLPKVALGHWPPGFYAALAPFAGHGEHDRATTLFGVALLHAATAWLVFRLALPLAGMGWALLAGAATTLMPTTRELADAVMAEPLVAACELLAVAAAARLFAAADDGRRTKWLALGFGLACAAAVLTKGTGFRLAMLPIFGWLLLRDWRGPTRPRWWLALAALAVVAGPWYLLTRGFQSRHLELAQGGGLKLVADASWFYLRVLLANVGFVALLAPAAAMLLRRPRVPEQHRFPLAALLAHALAAFVFQAVVVPKVGVEARHLHSAVLSATVLAAWGLSRLTHGRSPETTAICVLAACLAPGAMSYGKLATKPGSEPDDRVYFMTPRHVGLPRPVTLVAGSPNLEGMAIAQLANGADPRPGFVALRSSKLFSESDWMGGGYRTKVKDAKEALAILDQAKVGAVVLRNSAPLAPHDALLAEALGGAEERWNEQRIRFDPPYDAGVPPAPWIVWTRKPQPTTPTDADLSELGRKWNLGEAQGFRPGH